MIVYHILAWAIPLELITIIEAVNIGYYPDTYVLRTSYICITLLIRFVSIPFWAIVLTFRGACPTMFVFMPRDFRLGQQRSQQQDRD